MSLNLTTWCTTQDRLIGFLELEAKMPKVTLAWVKDNIPQYYEFIKLFEEHNGFEQAHMLHAGVEETDHFLFFYNHEKLNGNPLILETKRTYNFDDLYVICLKVSYSLPEALYHCTTDPILQNELHDHLNGKAGKENS